MIEALCGGAVLEQHEDEIRVPTAVTVTRFLLDLNPLYRMFATRSGLRDWANRKIWR